VTRRRNRRQLTPAQLEAERAQWAQALARLSLRRQRDRAASQGGRGREYEPRSSRHRARARARGAPPTAAELPEPPAEMIADQADRLRGRRGRAS
jgi:hypothetical protein